MFNYESIKKLNDLEIIIYNYVISYPEKVVNMPIRKLADELHVSTSSVLRFCSKLGYEGYSEFKYKLKDWINDSNRAELVDDFTVINDFFKKVGTPEFDEKLDEIAKVIANKHGVVFIGGGTSGILAKFGARYMSDLGKTSLYIDDSYYPVSVGDYEDTAVVALSVSGEQSSLLEAINNFKAGRATIISLTNSHRCTLSALSDYNVAYYMPVVVLPGEYNVTSQVPLVFILENLAHKVYKLIREDKIN